MPLIPRRKRTEKAKNSAIRDKKGHAKKIKRAKALRKDQMGTESWNLKSELRNEGIRNRLEYCLKASVCEDHGSITALYQEGLRSGMRMMDRLQKKAGLFMKTQFSEYEYTMLPEQTDIKERLLSSFKEECVLRLQLQSFNKEYNKIADN